MASISPASNGKWGRRTLDAPINLVPYIDLMITIIAFLMMTAIWTQVAALDVQNTASASAVVSDNPLKPLSIEIRKDGFVLLDESSTKIEIPNRENTYDTGTLFENLKKWKSANSAAHQVDIYAQDGVLFENIAEVIDIAVGLQMPDVTLKPQR